MTDGWLGGELARETGDLFAHAHDDFNCERGSADWALALLDRAEAVGLQGDHLLDVGCGTGLSFIPLLQRGWAVTACDISGEMVEIARARVGELAVLQRRDMRELPVLDSFDLVWAINATVNYLLSREELIAALAAMRRNLAPSGIAIFDANTLRTYRTSFTREIEIKVGGRHLVWTGRVNPQSVDPGLIAEARFEARGEPGSAHLHYQRHFSEAEVLESIEEAELCCVEVWGERDGELREPLDEQEHCKAVYVCRAES